MEQKKGPTTELLKSVSDLLNHIGYDFIDEGNLYDALMTPGVDNPTLRTILSELVEDLQSFSRCLREEEEREKNAETEGKKEKEKENDGKELHRLDHLQKEGFLDNLIKFLESEGYGHVVEMTKIKEAGFFDNFIYRASLLDTLASEVATLKLLIARKVSSKKAPSAAQMVEAALEKTDSKKKAGDAKKEEDRSHEGDFEPVIQSIPPPDYLKHIYCELYDGKSQSMAKCKTIVELVKDIEATITKALKFFPENYLAPLLSVKFTPEQMKELESKHTDFKKDYEARRHVVVKRFFATLKSLLQSRRLDGLKQKALATYANQQIRLYLRSRVSTFTLYDALCLKYDALIDAQHDEHKKRVAGGQEKSSIKTVIVKGLAQPKAYLKVSKSKKKNQKKRDKKKKWAVDLEDQNTSLPAEVDLHDGGEGGDGEDGEDLEPRNDEEEVERLRKTESEKKERQHKREEDTKKQLAEIEKLKQEGKGQRLSKKDRMLLKQKEKQAKRQERKQRKVEKVKEANKKRQGTEGDDDDGEEEGEGEEGGDEEEGAIDN